MRCFLLEVPRTNETCINYYWQEFSHKYYWFVLMLPDRNVVSEISNLLLALVSTSLDMRVTKEAQIQSLLFHLCSRRAQSFCRAYSYGSRNS